MRRNSKTVIPYEDIDYELVELIKCINEVDGIETTECCCGHGTGPCQIWFKADSIEDVTHFSHNYLYCNPLWRIVINLTDVDIDDNEWNNPTYLLETTCSDYYYTGASIDNLKYKMQQKQRELEERKAITEEEAIIELQNTIDLIKQDGRDWVDERDIPLFEMAIKVLKGE